MDFKKPAAPFLPLVPVKRSFNDAGIVAQTKPRTSSLLAPIVQLSGHDGEIYAGAFSPDGTSLASAGGDRAIYLWNVYGECENFSTLRGHTGAILAVTYSTAGDVLFSASTDKTIRCWDMYTGTVIRKFKSAHQHIVNDVTSNRRGQQLIASASDDGTVKCWDPRQKEAVHSYQNNYQVTSVVFSDTSEQIISGGIDNDVKVWDIRKGGLSLRMRGHTDTVTGLSLSPGGSFILSNGMDNTLRIWDIRPFAPELRCISVFQGHQHNFEKNLLRCCWSPDGKRVSCGSSDRYVYVWDVASRRVTYKLPGHAGSVNQTAFHPNQPILLSVSSDKTIYLGEIEE